MNSVQLRVNIVTVDIWKVHPNVWNPNKQTDFIFEKELESIRTHGFLDPILVREIAGGFEIIDGEHRWRAAQVLDLKQIPVNNLGDVTDSTAKQLTLVMNELRGENERSKLAKLMQDIAKEVPVEELLKSLPFQEYKIESLLKETSVDWEKVTGPVVKPEAKGNAPLDEFKEDWKTFKVKLPEGVFDQLNEQILRFKKALHPEEVDFETVSPVMAIEAICQHLVQTTDDHLL